VDGSGGGGATPFLGLVATRCRMTQQTSGFASAMYRSSHTSTDAITSLKLVFPNFQLGNPDTSNAAVMTITASIEFPAGTFTQVKFGGSASGTIPDFGLVTSDFVNVSIPNATQFWVRFFQSGSGP